MRKRRPHSLYRSWWRVSSKLNSIHSVRSGAWWNSSAIDLCKPPPLQSRRWTWSAGCRSLSCCHETSSRGNQDTPARYFWSFSAAISFNGWKRVTAAIYAFAWKAHPNYPAGVTDNTHFSDEGAKQVAQLVAEAIRQCAELSALKQRMVEKNLDSDERLAHQLVNWYQELNRYKHKTDLEQITLTSVFYFVWSKTIQLWRIVQKYGK